MNQWLADLFLSLPRTLTQPHIFGTICLALCWLGYIGAIRGPITRAVRASCKPAFIEANLSRRWQRLFYTAARKKAKLDEGGAYLINLASFLLLAAVTVIHALLFAFCMQGMPLAVMADKILLTLLFCGICILCLITQPAATLERRVRWGFGRAGSVLIAVLWELLIAALLFLWLYDAWFLPALL